MNQHPATPDTAHLLTRLARRGAELVGQVAQYQNIDPLCDIRGPEAILIGLAEQLTNQSSRSNPMEK